jgi:hypothetical protein
MVESDPQKRNFYHGSKSSRGQVLSVATLLRQRPPEVPVKAARVKAGRRSLVWVDVAPGRCPDDWPTSLAVAWIGKAAAGGSSWERV